MPLVKRAVSPVNISLRQLPTCAESDELQCISNGTLANIIRQLSSICRHAENIFGEIYHEAVKLDHRMNTISQRIERLITKCQELDCNNQEVSLEDLHLRKPFKSNCIIDQHTFDRQTLPSSLSECYNSCAVPPNLDALNIYRDDCKNALRYYTDPSYFFDLWRKEMLKDVGDGHKQKAYRPSETKIRKKERRSDNSVRPLKSPSSRNVVASQQHLNFPVEYQAPNITNVVHTYIPFGMSLPENGKNQIVSSKLHRYDETKFTFSIPAAYTESFAAPFDSRSSPMCAIGDRMMCMDIQDVPAIDDDDELPPPPPPLMHTSLVSQIPNPPTMNFVAPSDSKNDIPPPPPLPPSNRSNIAVIKSFAHGEEDSKASEKSQLPHCRLDLLAEIQTGIKLKQVQRREKAAEEKAAAEANDVAAILRRRMEHVLGNSDSESDSACDDEEWD